MNFYNSNNGDEVIEITIKDFSGRKLEKFKFKVNDKYAAQKILSILMDKYAFK